MKFLVVLIAAALPCAAQTFSGAADLDSVIEDAIQHNDIPGAVVTIGHKGQTVYQHAYGYRSVLPGREPMTEDTIFDAASLTKVIATTSACMKLFEEGKLRLNDSVTRYLPEFQGGRTDITIRDLMTHFSGLRPDLDLQPAWSGYATGIKRAFAEKSTAPAGARFVYSDINFILLGEIVHRLSSEMLSEYVGKNVFAPLGMKDTMFQPTAELIPRIAPTESVDGQPLRGIVHDETTRYMGGVAGHAGLFTTAADLARFAEMMLHDGELNGVRVFSPLTVRKFTTPQSPPDQPILRGLGWDIESPFSGNRGELYPVGSYGHTGFTGTSIWMDPASDSYVILLTNSVHPWRRPAITSLRGRVATIVAKSFGMDAPGITISGYDETLFGSGVHRVVARNASVLTGLDYLESVKFAPLAGKRIGLITNHTGIDRDGKRNVDRMLEAGLKVVALFSPEHGLLGREDRGNLPDTKDAATGIPVWSLYGKDNRPTAESLHGVDALVFDIQDIGARFYTYVTTMAYAMEEAAKQHVPFYVLDRPNPITGTHVEGPLLDPDLRSFVGYFQNLPLRHGMTMGELAKMFNGENRIGAELTVVQVRNWHRGDWFDSTSLTWVDPSPNMRSLNAALLYPGVALLEYSKNYSVGRGTDAPFEQIGADWMHGAELAALLNSRFIPGVRAYPTRFQPAASNFAGSVIEGVRFVITDREAFDSARLGLELAAAIQKLYPGKVVLADNARLVGNRDVMARLEKAEAPVDIQESGEDALQSFLKVREKYLLYR